jgi:hypothetical protein
MAHRVIRGTSCQAICAPRTVADGRESRARIALGGTLFYENSDRSEYTGEVFGGLTYVKFDSWEIGIVPT